MSRAATTPCGKMTDAIRRRSRWHCCTLLYFYVILLFYHSSAASAKSLSIVLAWNGYRTLSLSFVRFMIKQGDELYVPCK